MGDHKLLSVTQTADHLGVSASYLNKLRVTGGGPAFVKMGARVSYDLADLKTWVDGQKRISTSARGERQIVGR